MRLVALSLLFCLASFVAQAQVEGPTQKGPAWVWAVDGDFKAVKNDVIDTIEANGLVVSYIAYAANMLARTSEAVGDPTPVYDQAETLLFCKADLSHNLAKQDPHNIVLCPYSISLYSLIENPDRIYVSLRLPELNVAAYSEVHSLLEDIVNQALEWYR